MPVYKDLGSPGMLYCRSYGGTQMLVSEGTAGEALAVPDAEQGDVPIDHVAEVGAQVAARFPSFESAGLASAWTGVYDVTPDWNPVLGRVLAQEALGLPTDVPLEPYALGRFRAGRLLRGRYGSGAVS
jgi:sarcosine oxidase subunit beta